MKDANGKELPFNLKSGAGALSELMTRLEDVALIVIDPISAYLDGIDSHKNADMRGALVPLQALAEKFKASVLMISHFNKGTADGLALSRVSGSGALGAVCRSCWMVERDPNDLTGEARVFMPMKNNIGNDRYGFAFGLETCEVAGGIQTSRVRFLPGRVEISADELASSSGRSNEKPDTSLEAASAFLIEYLANGAQTSRDVTAAAKIAGHSKRTIERAKKQQRVRHKKGGNGWMCLLPEHFTKTANEKAQDRQGGQDRQPSPTDEIGVVQEALPSRGQVGEDRHLRPSEMLGGVGELGGLDDDALADAFKN